VDAVVLWDMGVTVAMAQVVGKEGIPGMGEFLEEGVRR